MNEVTKAKRKEGGREGEEGEEWRNQRRKKELLYSSKKTVHIQR